MTKFDIDMVFKEIIKFYMRTRKNRIIIHIRVTTIELRIRRRVSGVRRQSWYVRLKEDGLQAERQYRNLKVYWNCGYWREMPNRERQPYMRRRQTYCNMVILSLRVKSEGVVNCSDCKCKKKRYVLRFWQLSVCYDQGKTYVSDKWTVIKIPWQTEKMW